MATTEGFSRRGFLALAAAAALDPERLLWVPGRRLISIPAVSPFLAVGDIVTFGDWSERYIVIESAQSRERIGDARFGCIDALPRIWPGRVRRIGDTVHRNCFREMMNLLPETLHRASGRGR